MTSGDSAETSGASGEAKQETCGATGPVGSAKFMRVSGFNIFHFKVKYSCTILP